MLEVKKEGIVLSKSDAGFEIEGVLNPAVIHYGDYIHMFYRAVGKGNYSSIGYAKFKTPLEVVERMDVPVIFPQFDYEEHGVEDGRIVLIDNLFYLSYCAFDGVNALGALATSTDLITWEKKGIIVPQMMFDEFSRLAGTKSKLNQKYFRYNDHEGVKEKNGKRVMVWDKNVVFFPRRINGKLHFLHRIKPDIQIVCVNDLSELTPDFWQNYLLRFKDYVLLYPILKHEISYIGGGCPPIETKNGWLLIYHGVYDTVKGFVYCACVALLDLEKPEIVLAQLPYPLFKPELDWELKGEVNNVCFPTGAVVIDDTLYIYYGAADERIACASMSLTELLSELMLNKK
ncbi:MAG: pesticidal protein Cry7Aa [Flavobacterium sp.]|nr:pesticidal protein Cry7Aa [Flavobacterium sp.]